MRIEITRTNKAAREDGLAGDPVTGLVPAGDRTITHRAAYGHEVKDGFYRVSEGPITHLYPAHTIAHVKIYA